MKRVHLNAVVDAGAMLAFMLLASTGFVLRIQLPPGSGDVYGRGMGRGAMQRSIELLWGWTRHEWGDIHYWIALGLLVVLSFHLFLHWKWIVSVVRGTKSEASGWRFGIGLFSLAMTTLLVCLPLLTNTSTTTRQQLQHERSESKGELGTESASPWEQ
ncbi:MAG: DUF4405 domain-containing protein [Pirellulales bacterium]